jgi:hypothetical protein
VDWTRGNREDSFFGVFVDPFNLDKEFERVELGEFSLIANYYSDERITGSMTTPPGFPNVGNRLLRIYMQSESDSKLEITELGTFFMKRGESTIASDAKKRDIELHSTLWKYITDFTWQTNVWKPGTDAIAAMNAFASRVLGPSGLLDTKGVISKPLRQPVIYKGGITYLTVINWFADYAGAEAASVDAHGRCYIAPYISPSKRAVAWTFEDGVNCMYEDELIANSNEDDIPTGLTVVYDQGDTHYNANRSLPASSPYSEPQRGRYQSVYYEHSDFSLEAGWPIRCTTACKLYAQQDTSSQVIHDLWVGGQVTMTQAQAGEWIWINNWWESHDSCFSGWAEARNFFSSRAVEKKADEYFERLTSLAISIEFTHHFAPIKIGDVVRYIRGNTNVLGIVHAMEIEGTQGAITRTVIDRLDGALGDVYP